MLVRIGIHGARIHICYVLKSYWNDVQDLVFAMPPPQFPFQTEDNMRHGVDMSTVWYGRVLLLFKVTVQLDDDIPHGPDASTDATLEAGLTRTQDATHPAGLERVPSSGMSTPGR